MILLTRLSGSVFVLNSDLVERIDATPDTVITLTDGTRYVVAESLPAVTSIIRRYRAELIALSSMVPARDPLDGTGEGEAPSHRPVLSLVEDRVAHGRDGLPADHARHRLGANDPGRRPEPR